MPAKTPDEHTRRLGQTIALLRHTRGWSQADLASQLGTELGRTVDPSLVTRMERGQRVTSHRDLGALAKILGVELDLLASENDPLAWDGFEEWRARATMEAAAASLEDAARAYGVALADLAAYDEAEQESAATIAERGEVDGWNKAQE